MQFSILSLALMSGMFTAIGAVIASIVIRVLTNSQFVTQPECHARHSSDRQINAQLISKIDGLKNGQEKYQEDMVIKNALLFRMLRAMIAHMDLTPEQRERILNERHSG